MEQKLGKCEMIFRRKTPYNGDTIGPEKVLQEIIDWGDVVIFEIDDDWYSVTVNEGSMFYGYFSRKPECREIISIKEM